MLQIKKYQPEHKKLWDDFVDKSKNATFLFKRDFMEYHADRFEDFSLMVFEKNSLLAIIPAHRQDGKVCSHLGLTYGGIIFENKTGITKTELVFKEIILFLRLQNTTSLILKLIPINYQQAYNSAIEYLLFQHNAKLIRRDLNYIINLKDELNIHKSKLKFQNKSDWNIFTIQETNDLTSFWNEILIPVLKEKYGQSPVHNLEEITSLKNKFPENIKQFNVLNHGKIISGMTLFVTKNSVKSQYGASNIDGQNGRALDFLYLHLLRKYKSEGFHYFDMGITNENEGFTYNAGLSKYKEEFGASPVNQDRYELLL